MGNKQIKLKIITPRRIVFDQAVDSVIIRTTEGDMGILHGHEPCSALLDFGMLRIISDNQKEYLSVLGGFATVSDNEVVVLSAMAERPEMLQESLNKLSEERAANKLKEQASNVDMHRIEKLLRQALVHTDVSSYSIIKGRN